MFLLLRLNNSQNTFSAMIIYTIKRVVVIILYEALFSTTTQPFTFRSTTSYNTYELFSLKPILFWILAFIKDLISTM